MEKNVAVVIGDTVHDVAIRPGTTAQDVLRQLNLSGDYVLSRKDGLPFGTVENIYELLSDGEKTYASAKAVVGSVHGSL